MSADLLQISAHLRVRNSLKAALAKKGSAYADENAPEGKVFEDPVCGWNTWDYYRWTITEDEVLKNAEFIAKDPVLSKHVKRIIIDDGWQYCYGEWGMPPLPPCAIPSILG